MADREKQISAWSLERGCDMLGILFAHPYRIAALNCLVQAEGEVPFKDIAAYVGATISPRKLVPSGVVRHLKEQVDSSLVDRSSEGVYSATKLARIAYPLGWHLMESLIDAYHEQKVAGLLAGVRELERPEDLKTVINVATARLGELVEKPES